MHASPAWSPFSRRSALAALNLPTPPVDPSTLTD
jgi:hypothetical protein